MIPDPQDTILPPEEVQDLLKELYNQKKEISKEIKATQSSIEKKQTRYMEMKSKSKQENDPIGAQVAADALSQSTN